LSEKHWAGNSAWRPKVGQ